MVIQVVGLIKVLGSVQRKRAASQVVDREANDNSNYRGLENRLISGNW